MIMIIIDIYFVHIFFKSAFQMGLGFAFPNAEAGGLWEASLGHKWEILVLNKIKTGHCGLTFVISTQEVKAEESLWVWGHFGLYNEFQAILSYRVKPCQKNNIKTNKTGICPYFVRVSFLECSYPCFMVVKFYCSQKVQFVGLSKCLLSVHFSQKFFGTLPSGSQQAPLPCLLQ